MTSTHSTPTHVDPRWREMLYFVLVVPPLLAWLNTLLINFYADNIQPKLALGSYLWLCFECAAVSFYVGRKLKNSRAWWGVFAWTILLIDIHVWAMTDPMHHWMDPTKMLGYAFASGQAGIAVVGSILSSVNWRIRTSLLVGGILWAVTLGFIMHHDGMMLLLLGQTVATLGFCLALRTTGFRIACATNAMSMSTIDGKASVQFSIQHLLVSTTLVGLVVGVARWTDIASLFRFMQARDLPYLVWVTVALTVISIIATWAALGRESWLVRVPLCVVLLPMVGAAIGYWQPPARGGGGYWIRMMSSGLYSPTERILSWGIWATLAGLFLAGTLLVFRADGRRLVRLARKRASSTSSN